MGRWDDASVHFEDALCFWRREEYRPDLAWSFFDYAETIITEAGGGPDLGNDRQRAMALLEEALVMSSIIYSGLLDRSPRLKSVMAHGGGFLPYYAGRVDRAFDIRPETRVNIDRKPSAYMRKF